MNKLNQLKQEITQKEKEVYNILHKEINKFKGKFFKNKEDKIVKISIFKVKTTDWSNVIDYVRCFYCKDKHNSWWEIDEKMNFEYTEYDLEKLKEAIEISKDEYEKKRNVLIEQARKDEIDKIKQELKK